MKVTVNKQLNTVKEEKSQEDESLLSIEKKTKQFKENHQEICQMTMRIIIVVINICI